MDKLEALNQGLFLKINGGLDSPSWLVSIAYCIAQYLIYFIPLLLIAFWLSGSEVKRQMALKAFVVALMSLGAAQLFTRWWPHPRPFMMGIGNTFMQHAPDPSFPSDHLTAFVSVGLPLLLDGELIWGFTILYMGALVAWARIFLGVHFPLDMFGALVLVVLIYLAILPIWKRVGLRVTGMFESIYRLLMRPAINAGWLRR